MNSASSLVFLRIPATLLVAALALGCATASFAGPDREKSEEKRPGSIQLAARPKPFELPALAKISFEQALKTALAAAPGKIVKAELEVEDGCLMYSFEIVTAPKTVTEVEIDAGTGAVLGVDHD